MNNFKAVKDRPAVWLLMSAPVFIACVPFATYAELNKYDY